MMMMITIRIIIAIMIMILKIIIIMAIVIINTPFQPGFHLIHYWCNWTIIIIAKITIPVSNKVHLSLNIEWLKSCSKSSRNFDLHNSYHVTQLLGCSQTKL